MGRIAGDKKARRFYGEAKIGLTCNENVKGEKNYGSTIHKKTSGAGIASQGGQENNHRGDMRGGESPEDLQGSGNAEPGDGTPLAFGRY